MQLNSIDMMLNEGVYDPGIFKVFILAGGPGSGKSFVTKSVFAGTGLKVVNSDTYFERELKKASLSLQMPDRDWETCKNKNFKDTWVIDTFV